MSSFFCFFKQKTAYEMRISDWSSDVCSSDLKSCSPEGSEAASAVVDVQVTVTGLKTALSSTSTVKLELRKDGADAEKGSVIAVEPVLPNRTPKSVVVGEGVSLRCVLGWLRIIKKKTIVQIKNN